MGSHKKNDYEFNHILIVEDSLTQAEQLKFILEQNAYETAVAHNGKEALSYLKNYKPSIIISDIIMPEMDGFELCRTIKSKDRFKNIHIILLTTLSDPEDIIKGLSCGADNFIMKPYDENYLISQIKHIRANRELTKKAKSQFGIEIFFAGQKHLINSDRIQILNLLIAIYETALQKNRELEKAMYDLSKLNIQLETANKELEAFSYSVSHDMRAPLRAIDGFSRILIEEYGDNLNAEGNRLLNIIRTNTKKMDQLIIDLLSLSRVSRSEMKFHRIDMTNMANSIYHEVVSPEVQQKFSFTVAQLPNSHGDSNLMRQVWSNLISNAVKYTSPKEVREVVVGSKTENDVNIYYVKDTGVGFNPDYTHKLFGVFQRLHTEKEFEGTGVGLAIVQRIIHKHGGNVWAEGKINEGATFYFSLPNRE